jgi:hypothetical protein
MKNLITNLIVFISVAALFTSCSTKSSIVGKWEEIGGERKTMEYLKDGTISATFKHGTKSPILPDRTLDGDMTFVGKYSFVESDRVKVEFSGAIGAATGPMIIRISISGDELTETMDGEVAKYKRVK